MLRRISSLVLLLAAAPLAAACGDDSPTGPSDPGAEPVEIVETFPAETPGTLLRNGGATHRFVVQQAGSITVSLTTLAPDDTIIGVGLGSWNGLACAQTIVKDDSTLNTSIIGTATATGEYCVRVYDATGDLAQPVTYQVTVRHF